MRAALIGLVTGAACLASCPEPAQAYERPWLGIFVAPAAAPRLGPESERWRGAALVAKSEGPASSAGVRLFDLVVEIDGEPITDSGDLVCRIAALAPGSSVRLTLVRARQQLTVTATLGHWPDSESADKPPPGCGSDAVSATGWPAVPG